MRLNHLKTALAVFLSLSALFSAGCPKSADTEPDKSDLASRNDEIGVYSALFEGDTVLRSLKEVLIVNRTTCGRVGPASTCEDVIEQLSLQKSRVIDDEIVSDFRIKNLDPTGLPDKFTIHTPHRIVDDDFLRSALAKDLPVVDLSRVAFNRQRTKAAMYVSVYISSKTAKGGFRTFEKIDGNWVISERLDVWVS